MSWFMLPYECTCDDVGIKTLEAGIAKTDDESKSMEAGFARTSSPSLSKESRHGSWPVSNRLSLSTADWMSYITDDTLLSALTIPGTHDSAAYTSSWPFISTQRLSIEQQLDAGIRYFDIRCGIRDDVVELVHGLSYLGLRLSDVLQVMYQFLDEHRQEAVIVQIKEDRRSERSTIKFADAIAGVISSGADRWRMATTMPMLGEVRGKIQLLRRFRGSDTDSYGIDVTQWQDNPPKPFTIFNPDGSEITIQDHYSVTTPEGLPSLVAHKHNSVLELLGRAMGDRDPGNLYINFTSAYEINVYYQIPPHSIAAGALWGFRRVQGVNALLRTTLAGFGRERQLRLGILALDFPEQGADDLVEALIATNFEEDSDDDVGRYVALRVLLLLLLVALLCGLKSLCVYI